MADSAAVNEPPKVNRGKTLDDTLIELAAGGMSRKEISERIGGILTPERVDQKLNALLEAPDWLTDIQQERALLQLVRINLMELRSNFKASDEEYLDAMKLQLAYIDRIFERYNRRKAATDEELGTWNQNVGREIGAIVDETLAYMKGALRGEIDGQSWEALKLEAMQHAWHRIEAKQQTEITR